MISRDMQYLALACDFDQTLANQGLVAASALTALERLRASGRKLILVTGRQLDDLLRVFPEAAIFERVVAENGAVLHRPAAAETKLLAASPPEAFLRVLRRRGVQPLSIGAVIVASNEPQDETILSIIRELGLELQLIYNKGAVMVLPPGVNKGTGLLAALDELSLSPQNTVGIGDAENDLALLSVCECGIAVANSIPTLIERADFTTVQSNGKGVEEIVDKLLADDLRGIPNRLSRGSHPTGRHG
jgi:hydroxymethylpyrimidine pyrophosphatase-like HAD family hydrolase